MPSSECTFFAHRPHQPSMRLCSSMPSGQGWSIFGKQAMEDSVRGDADGIVLPRGPATHQSVPRGRGSALLALLLVAGRVVRHLAGTRGRLFLFLRLGLRLRLAATVGTARAQ